MSLTEFQPSDLKRAYQILDVPLSAPSHSIKQAYRRLVKRWHPDRYATESAAHADSDWMMKLINDAYSKIEAAPLRYFIEAIPLAQRKAAQGTPPSTYKSNDNISETFPKTDRIESSVRFVCGDVFGVLVSLDLVLNFIESSAVLDRAIVGIIIGSGFAAARYGDKFWYSIVQRWWRWP